MSTTSTSGEKEPSSYFSMSLIEQYAPKKIVQAKRAPLKLIFAVIKPNSSSYSFTEDKTYRFRLCRADFQLLSFLNLKESQIQWKSNLNKELTVKAGISVIQ